MAHWLCPTAPGISLLKPSSSILYALHRDIPKSQLNKFDITPTKCRIPKNWIVKNPFIVTCSSSTTSTLPSVSESEYETKAEYVSEEYDGEEEEGSSSATVGNGKSPLPLQRQRTFSEEYDGEEEEEGSSSATVGNGKSPLPLRRQRRRYRKQYPGEAKGITEEMRFVAMKLRNSSKKKGEGDDESEDKELEKNGEDEENSSMDKEIIDNDQNGQTWQPSMEGFLKYLVDSKLVFSTVERIVDESSDVSYVYFRKTELERSECLSKDLEWFSRQGNVIPQPSNPGITYSQYLEKLAEKSPPLFLSHFYNIYFSHIAGGQVIAKQASEKLSERELEFYQWERDAEELLKGVREKLNALSMHWSRDEKNKCLKETTKAFRFLGQIVRLIIL